MSPTSCLPVGNFTLRIAQRSEGMPPTVETISIERRMRCRSARQKTAAGCDVDHLRGGDVGLAVLCLTAGDAPRLLRTLILVVTLLLLSGCGGKDETSTKENEKGEVSSQGPIRREVDLAILGDYGPPLDSARVEIAPAKGWKTLPRTAPYLVRYSASTARNNPLPHIQITAEASTFGATTLTEEHLSEFVETIEEELKARNQDKSIRPSNEPVGMVIGGRACVRYVLAGRLRIGATELAVDSQILVTVVNARRYTLELQVVKGEIPSSRDASYAVLAGMKFSADAVAPPEPKPGASQEVDKPESEDASSGPDNSG